MVDLKNCAKFEIAKHCFDEELSFRIRNRRNRLLGLWAAARLGMTGEKADAYAKWVVSKGIDHPSDQLLMRRIVDNAAASGVVLADGVIRSEMDRLSRIAAMEYAATERPSQRRAA
jgi:hypothetical protein